MNERKQCVSVRLKPRDLKTIARLAARLNTRVSDVIRYSFRTTLTRLLPLHDENVSGRQLLPLFIEMGPELIQNFDLDADRLENILNKGVQGKQHKVDRMDIELLILGTMPPQHLRNRLIENLDIQCDLENAQALLHDYLREKYLGNTHTPLNREVLEAVSLTE